MGENAQVTSLDRLVSMTPEQRHQYFLDHPLPGVDPAIDPDFVARSRARLVPIVADRDIKQAAEHHAS